ncbi:hypothetical protein BB559_002939 [Furculomyces boomerangus]|uniref:Uncharacterized protein n=1 Tax=Furculomyces boomerangus TaxID=61424 RepID=A0A2T9YQW8_9FUNG|nr:hypothetical protein BB559_002939 [Furculomyces boomerangus]
MSIIRLISKIQNKGRPPLPRRITDIVINSFYNLTVCGSKEESKVFESQSNKSLKVPNNLPLFRTGNNSFKDPERLLIAFRRALIAHGLNENENWNILLPICTSEYVAFWIERNINPDFSFEGMQKSLIRQYTNVFRDQRLVKQLLLMKPFD